MRATKRARRVLALLTYILSGSTFFATEARSVHASHSQDVIDFWAHENLFAWGVISVDSTPRSPEQRAQMLSQLGIKQFAFDWDAKDIPIFEPQIEAFRKQGIRIIAWSINDADNPREAIDWKSYKVQDIMTLAGLSAPASNAPTVGSLLEMFKRYGIAPQLWVIRRMGASGPAPKPSKPYSGWTDAELNQGFRDALAYDLTHTPEEWRLRVRQEADHIKPLADLAASYGVKVALYKHSGWIGMAENQVAVMKRLNELGVKNVGVVYNFIHAHDEVDDTSNFPVIWRQLQPYVLAVNVTGLHTSPTQIYPILYPSQGDTEARMLRVILDSGWRGPIGLSSEKGGDAEINLRNNIIGFDWIATELSNPGSGGQRPFPSVR